MLTPDPRDAGAVDPAAGPVRPPGRRRVRCIAALSGLALLAPAGAIAWNWPTDQYAQLGGPVLDLDARVEIGSDVDATEINGSFDGLTVRAARLDLGDLLVHHLTDDDTVLVPEHQVRPPDVDPATHRARQKAAFVDGGQVAAAVAQRALGMEVSVTSDGVGIVDIAPGSAADGRLDTGDVITAVNDEPAILATDLSAAIESAAGASVDLAVTDDAGASRTVSITPAPLDGAPRPVLGVVVGEIDPEIALEVPVTVDDRGVIGPSAGLLTALTIFDKLAVEDLAAGRTIAGTGTLAFDGTVGPIGGIEAKARAAEAAGADVFLAPASQAASARAVLDDRVPVVGVRTFDEAVAALSSIDGGDDTTWA